ncbi:cip1-interacting zinc finger protein isoform 2-T3 [Discoglossus pictus]
MFNPQQQQFHQLMQLQHLLQQQHPAPHHHPGPRVMPPPVQHQQPQQMMNLRAANPARLLNTHPMLQRALLMQHMQGNLRGLNMAAPPMPPFFTAASRQSILGTPPMGVTVKAPRMGFPGLPFQQHHRMYQKDHFRSFDRKREAEQGSSKADESNDKPLGKGEEELPPAASEADENVSSSDDSENLTERSISDPLEPSAKRARSSETDAAEADIPSGTVPEETEGAGERSVKSEHPEGVSEGRALKVTIQQRSESRTISTTALNTAQTGPRFYCCICKTNCHSLQNFQSHLVTALHHQRFQEIQHLSNACLVTLLPTAKDNQGTTIGKDGKKKQLRWCNVCQIHFSSDLIKHRRTQEHKLAKRSLRPFCTVCSRHFKTPRKFVEHMKSPEHKQKSQEVRLGEKEPVSPEEPEELITVDAVGCFEEDDDEEDDEEEGISEDDTSGEAAGPLAEAEEMSFADTEGWEEYNADTAYGLDFMVPVAGYLCRLCHKFYSSDSSARLTHCKSLMHFQNVQRYKAVKSQVSTQPTTKLENQEAEVASDKTPTEQLRMAEKTDKTLQDDEAQGASYEDLTDEDHEMGDLVIAEDSDPYTESLHGPGDGLESTSEEDPGYILEPENLLTQEPTGESKPQEETSTTQEDTTPSGCRRSTRHKLR